MKTKECPSCAMEIDSRSRVCPICSYEFPETAKGIKWVAIALVLILLILIFFL